MIVTTSLRRAFCRGGSQESVGASCRAPFKNAKLQGGVSRSARASKPFLTPLECDQGTWPASEVGFQAVLRPLTGGGSSLHTCRACWPAFQEPNECTKMGESSGWRACTHEGVQALRWARVHVAEVRPAGWTRQDSSTRAPRRPCSPLDVFHPLKQPAHRCCHCQHCPPLQSPCIDRGLVVWHRCSPSLLPAHLHHHCSRLRRAAGLAVLAPRLITLAAASLPLGRPPSGAAGDGGQGHAGLGGGPAVCAARQAAAAAACHPTSSLRSLHAATRSIATGTWCAV